MLNKKVICVIPARLNSKRFPKKVLSSFLGKPTLQWVFEAALKVKLFDKVMFAIDSEETARLLKTFNAPYVMTSPECPSGTYRLIEVMQKGIISGDIWVCWQGDSPFIKPEMIQELLQTANIDGAHVWTLKQKISDYKDIENPNVVKVVCDQNNNALYFSRSTIPYYRDKTENKTFFKHVGIYAYTQKCLEKLSKMLPSYLEKAEKLEQLNFLYYGLNIKVHATKHDILSGIDTVEDITTAEKYYRTNGYV